MLRSGGGVVPAAVTPVGNFAAGRSWIRSNHLILSAFKLDLSSNLALDYINGTRRRLKAIEGIVIKFLFRELIPTLKAGDAFVHDPTLR